MRASWDETVNPKKAFRKFGDAIMAAGDAGALTVGLSWVDDGKVWRVVMMVTVNGVPGHALMLDSRSARALADTNDKQHQAPEWRGKKTGLEWVAPMLRELADEIDEKNKAGAVPPEMPEHVEIKDSERRILLGRKFVVIPSADRPKTRPH